MEADLAMMFPVSLLGMRGQCYSVVTLVIIVSPAGAWSELTRAGQLPSARISPALVSSVSGTQRLDPGLGRKFYKIVSFVVTVSGSVFLPSRVFQSILWRYKLPQYICSPRVHCFYWRYFKPSFRLAPTCPEVLQACLPDTQRESFYNDLAGLQYISSHLTKIKAYKISDFKFKLESKYFASIIRGNKPVSFIWRSSDSEYWITKSIKQKPNFIYLTFFFTNFVAKLWSDGYNATEIDNCYAMWHAKVVTTFYVTHCITRHTSRDGHAPHWDITLRHENVTAILRIHQML